MDVMFLLIRSTWAVEGLEAFSFFPINYTSFGKQIFLSGNLASQNNLVFF